MPATKTNIPTIALIPPQRMRAHVLELGANACASPDGAVSIDSRRFDVAE
jgi:hypothetical protein